MVQRRTQSVQCVSACVRVCACDRDSVHSGALGCGILKHYFVSLTSIPSSPHIFFCLSSRSQRLALCTAYHIWTWRERGRVDGVSLLCCQKQWKVVYSQWEYIVSWVEGVHVYRLHGGGCFCSSRPWRRALLKREGHSSITSQTCSLSVWCWQTVWFPVFVDRMCMLLRRLLILLLSIYR